VLFSAVALLAVSASGSQTLNVFAAASLHEAMTAIADRFERDHAGVLVAVQFGGSQQLAAQISEGAPCDVFASADERNLDKIAYDPTTRRVFALNRLVVVTPLGSVVRRLPDLVRAKRIVLAAIQVPAGAYANKALVGAAEVYGARWLQAVRIEVVSYEQDVRQVLAKVELGEADAGMVYASDAESAHGRVAIVAIPIKFQPRIEYPIAVTKDAENRGLAVAFVQTVMSPYGQSELKRRGFIPAK
jgi:molybdate transport system substrate-binding protein